MKNSKSTSRFQKIEHLVCSMSDQISKLNINGDCSSSDARTLKEEHIDRLELRLHSLIAQLRGVRNSHQHIHRLPPELLVLIFQNCQSRLSSFIPLSPANGPAPSASASTSASTGSRRRTMHDHVYCGTSHRDWWKLPSVCRAWRGVLATNPSLWNIIDTSYNPMVSMKRAAGYNFLTVYLGIRGGVIPPRLMEDVSKSMDRVQELHLNSATWDSTSLTVFPSPTDHPSLFSYLQENPAPQLTSLSLYLGHGPLPHRLFSNQPPPQLRHLSITMECMYSQFLPTNLFSTHLTHLFLCFKMQLNFPNTNHFLDCLESSPGLQELALIDMQTGNRAGVPTNRIVLLNHLQTLNIGNWHSTRTARFLSQVHIPNAKDVFIWCSEIDDTFKEGEDITSLLPPPSESAAGLTFLPWLTSTHSLTITWLPSSNLRRSWSHYKFHFVAVTNGTLHIHALPAALINPGLTTIGRGGSGGGSGGGGGYPVSQIQTLTVQDGTQSITDIKWRDILSHMGSLRQLNILGWRLPQFTRSILTALLPFPSSSTTNTTNNNNNTYTAGRKKPKLTDPKFSIIHCPHLQAIYLEAESSPPVFVLRSLVEQRSHRNASFGSLEVVLYRERSRKLHRHHITHRSKRGPEDEEAEPNNDEDEEEEEDEILNKHEEQDVMALSQFVHKVRFNGDPERVFDLVPLAWPTDPYRWYLQNTYRQ